MINNGFPIPSDKNIVATLVPNQVNIDMLMWQVFLTSSQYFNEVVAGVSYGANDSVGSRFAGSNLLNITSANLESNISAYTQGLQTLIANKNLLVASGTANAITLSTRVIDDSLEGGVYAKNAPLPLNFRDGLELDFVAIANNTGAVTISIPNFQGVNGALDIVKQDGSALIQGDIQIGYRYTIICDNTNNRFILKNATPAKATTYGLTYLTTKVNLTYNSATSLLYSVIDDESKDTITSGTINLATTGADGLDTGILQANTTYHIFEIKDLTNNLVKTITSTSLASPTLPSGFTKKKHIFSFITNASSQLRPMQIFNIGNNQYYVSYTNVIQEYNLVVVDNAGTNLSLTVPSGITVKAFLGLRKASISSGNVAIGVAPPHVTGNASSTFNVWFGGSSGVHDGGNEAHSFTDTNRTCKFFAKSDVTPTNLAIDIFTKGYYLYL